MERPESATRVPLSHLGMPGDGPVKTVTIQIGPQDLQTLLSAGYALCFAMNFAGVQPNYTVVGQALSTYLQSTTFSWLPEFKLFGANPFQNGVEVVALTNQQVIAPGETCILGENGNMGLAKTDGPPTGLTLVNQYGRINPGATQLLALNGQMVMSPVYVSPVECVPGTTTLQPVDKVLVWFEQQAQAGTMFSAAQTMSIEADLTIANSLALSFANQQWSIG